MIPSFSTVGQPVEAILLDAGVKFSRSGSRLRFAARWRGGTNPTSVSLDPGEGLWYDHKAGEGGGLAKLFRLLGIEAGADLHLAAPQARADADAAAEAADREAVAYARRLYSAGLLVSGGIPFFRAIIAKYLENRGLDIADLPPSAFPIRYRKTVAGCDLISPIVRRGEITGVSVLSLDIEGKKYPTPTEARKNHGKKPAGSYIALPRSRDARCAAGFETAVLIAEGLETAMAAQRIAGTNAISTVDALGMKKLLDDDAIIGGLRGKRIIACADRDLSQTGQRAAAALVRAARAAGLDACYAEPPLSVTGSEKSTDWDDVLLRFAGDTDAQIAALRAAIACGEKILESIPSADEIETHEYIEPANAISISQAGRAVREAVADVVLGASKCALIATTPGTGKSHAIARAVEENAANGEPVILIVPTSALAAEAASRSAALTQRFGRSGDIDLIGYCYKYPDTVVLGEKWRSISAQACLNCPHGDAASRIIKGEPADDNGAEPCKYILHQAEVKSASAVVAPAAAADCDRALARARCGDGSKPRIVLADDVLSVSTEKSVSVEDIAQWIQTGERATIAATAAARRDSGERDSLLATASATDTLVRELRHLAEYAAAHPKPTNTRLSADDFAGLLDAMKSTDIDVRDGTTCESIFTDEGRAIIPLRAIRALTSALARGTVWVRGTRIFFAERTAAGAALAEGIGVFADATPPKIVRDLMAAHGATIIDAPTPTPNLHIRQIKSRAGKTACEPDSPSGQRHLARLAGLARKAGPSAAVITHQSLAKALRALAEGDPTMPAPENIGWFGRHDRGSNEWASASGLVVYGSPSLAPAAAERAYEAERAEAAEGGVIWEPWDGAHADGDYQAEHVRAWQAEWAAAHIAQAIGRLRAVRRADEALSVTVVSHLDIDGQFGLQIRGILRAPWADRKAYLASGQRDRSERAALASALGAESIREARAVLAERGLDGLRNEGFALALASVPRPEWDIFALGNSSGLVARLDLLAADLAMPAKATIEAVIGLLEAAQPPADVAFSGEIARLVRGSPPRK